MNPNPPATDAGDPGKRPNRQIDLAFEEVARMSGTDMPPSDFFQEFLKKVLIGIEAPAGAVWLKNPQGFLQLQCQVNIDHVGLDNHKNGRQSHNELLRQAFQTAKPILLEPYGSTGILEGIPAGNPTDLVVLLVPVLVDEKNAVGLVEIWQDPRWDARAKRVHLNYLVQMAGYASTYFRTQQGRQTVNLEQFWTQLEAFSCQLHSSLDITTVSYHVANEGRRLIGCDRISVAVREGRKAKVEAVSGSDVVEKRATQVKLMRKLADGVLNWDEKLVYKGVKDDGLPPDVYEALDAYLAESHAKLLVFQPLRDPREKDKETKDYRPGSKARSALLMECFEPPAQPEPIIARLDVIGRHAASALYNATEMRKIPLGFMWKPILKVQEGLGGKTRFYTMLGTAIATIVILAMVLVPYDLKIDAKGIMLPVERRTMYAARPGTIEKFYVDPNSEVGRGNMLVELFDNELQAKIGELEGEAKQLEARVKGQEAQMNKFTSDVQREQFASQENSGLSSNKMKLNETLAQLNRLKEVNYAINDKPGHFAVYAPNFLANARRNRDPKWRVLSGNDFKGELQGKLVKPSDPLLRIGDVAGDWEIEIKIPQKSIGQIQAAFKEKDNPDEELDVDLKLESYVTQTYKGKLARRKISPEAVPNRDDHNETEPVVYAYVRIRGEGIAKADEIPEQKYLTGVDVRTKVRCGEHAMGYSLFYGVYEFVCEKLF
ncbi:MAG: hypothetical protein ACJ8F7_02920, partial [Gemmataceae bacterium]